MKNAKEYLKMIDDERTFTGSNHYMLKEFIVSDREIFDVKISHAKILNLI